MYYQCVGDIRGSCGHKHKTYATALKCLKDDQGGCESQGGYSDRRIVIYSDNGEPISYVEEEE